MAWAACASGSTYEAPDLLPEQTAEIRATTKLPKYFMDSAYPLNMLLPLLTNLGGGRAVVEVDVLSRSTACESFDGQTPDGTVQLTASTPERSFSVPASGCIGLRYRYSHFPGGTSAWQSCEAPLAFVPEAGRSYELELLNDPLRCEAKLLDRSSREQIASSSRPVR
jgi:hypothetical protein